MRIITRPIVLIVGNALGLYAASMLIPGFIVPPLNDWRSFGLLALALAVMNFVFKPIVKLFFGPIIVLTLGLGLLFINAVVLAVLDFFAEQLTIQSIPALVWGSLLIGAVNFIFYTATKK